MKKFYLLCTAVMAMFATTAQADRVLYSENYEDGNVPTTWTKNGSATTLTISGDSEGKYLSFYLPQENGRSAHCLWGGGIFDTVKEGLEEYSLCLDFQFQAFGNNQFNGELAVFSDENCVASNGAKSGNYSSYTNLSPNCLFNIAQNSHGDGKDAAASDQDGTHWFINGDSTEIFTPEANVWYTLALKINVATREVTYTLDDLDGTFHKSGSKVLADTASVFATGIYLMNARYQSVTNVDNLKVIVPGEFANDPVIALTSLFNEERTYAISFMEGETLHIVLPDGTENTVGYNDCEVPGVYVVKLNTSGTLKAYTTSGSMTSNTVEQEVKCEAIVLPAPTAKTLTAEEGFGKTVQFNVDKTTIEMAPDVFMDFSFKAENGTDDFTLENQNNGAKVVLPSKGVLTITTKAEGYTSSTSTYENSIEYRLDTEKSINFAHLTAEELAAVGYTADGNVTGNFANYGRLFCVTAANDTLVYNEIPQYTKFSSTFEDGTFYPHLYYIGNADAGAKFTEMVSTKVPVNVHIWQGVGLNFEGKQGDAADGKWIKYAYFMIDNVEEGEFVAVYIGGNYGNSDNDSNHPIVESLEEVKTSVNLIENRIDGYLAGEPISLNRVSDAIGRIDVYSPVNGTGIETVNTKQIYSANAPVYNLNGVQMSGALKKGVYIKQGKKFVVK